MSSMIAVLAFVAGLLVISAYRRGDAAGGAPMQYSQILWATLYGLLFFQETPETNTLIGAGIIIASGLYIVLRESRSGPSGTQPVLRTRSRPETGTTLRIGPILHAMARRTEKEPQNSLAKEGDAQ